jgi:hypothetical protein
MSKVNDYTPEEWKVISSAPMMAGLLVSVSDMAIAVVKMVNDTTSTTGNELIRVSPKRSRLKAGGRIYRNYVVIRRVSASH